jgi:hypothetical protein
MMGDCGMEDGMSFAGITSSCRITTGSQADELLKRGPIDMCPRKTKLALLCVCVVSGFPMGSAIGQQTVTFADLKGAVIHTLVRYQQVGSRNGRPFRNQVETKQTISIISDQTATVTTVFKNDAGQTSPTRSGSFTFGESYERPGGHHLWTFQDGELIHLQTFKAGGLRSTITFTRNSDKGIVCTLRSVHLRESGVTGWNWTSPIVGGDIQMESIKAISSSCEVSLR